MRAHVGLYHAVEFLHHNQAIHLRGEVAEQLDGQRVHQAQLQHAGLGKGFLHVQVAGAGGDKADVGIPHLHPVQFGGLGEFAQGLHALFHLHMALHGVGRGGHVLLGVALVGLQRVFVPFVQFHQALAVGHAGAGAQHRRRIVLFGNIIGRLHEIPAFPGIRRLQHGQL